MLFSMTPFTSVPEVSKFPTSKRQEWEYRNPRELLRFRMVVSYKGFSNYLGHLWYKFWYRLSRTVLLILGSPHLHPQSVPSEVLLRVGYGGVFPSISALEVGFSSLREEFDVSGSGTCRCRRIIQDGARSMRRVTTCTWSGKVGCR